MGTSHDGWLQLPTQPRTFFERTPLALAICQVRFPTMLNVASPGTVAAFQAAIQDDYPIGTPVTQFGIAFNVQSGQIAGMQGPASSMLWRFSDALDDWAVVLSQDFVSLETRSYESFEDFETRLRNLLEALANTVRPKRYTRIGLRYINELRPGHQDWTAVVRAELLGPMAVSALARHGLRWSQQILLEGPNGTKLQIQQGVVPEGTTVEPRAGEEEPPREPFYLLDLDAYQEFARPLPEMSVTNIMDHVRAAHGTTSELFRWAMTESYAKSLGERSDASS